MTTIREYFDTDIKALNAEDEWIISDNEGLKLTIIYKLSYMIDEKLKFFSLYFPKEANISTIEFILNKKEISEGIIDINESIQSIGYADNPERTSLNDFTFVKNIFIYIDKEVDEIENSKIIKYGNSMGFNITIRDRKYANATNELSTPLAFISHDSKDKDSLVRELANEMISLNCPVWYDEYTLNVGDNLRKKIEDGIRDTSYCIVVLSKDFITNEKWASSEFETIFIKEIHEQGNIILPIWHGVTEEDIYKFCPKLLNILGTSSSKDIKSLAKELVSKIKS